MSGDASIDFVFEPGVAFGDTTRTRLDSMLTQAGFEACEDTYVPQDLTCELMEYRLAEQGAAENLLIYLFVAQGQLARLSIDTNVSMGFSSYTDRERAFLQKLESLSLDLHQRLGARETKAATEHSPGDPWFIFSEETWEHMPYLPLEKEVHRYNLTLFDTLSPNSDTCACLDSCMKSGGFVPWRALSYNDELGTRRIPWENRHEAQANSSSLTLRYIHQDNSNAYSLVSMTFDKQTKSIKGLSLFICFSEKDFVRSTVTESVDHITSTLATAFNGRCWNTKPA